MVLDRIGALERQSCERYYIVMVGCPDATRTWKHLECSRQPQGRPLCRLLRRRPPAGASLGGAARFVPLEHLAATRRLT